VVVQPEDDRPDQQERDRDDLDGDEGDAEDDTGYSSAWVRINQSTTIRWSTPGDAATATIAELEPGMRVEVRFSGAVALSDPVQATAAEITIID